MTEAQDAFHLKSIEAHIMAMAVHTQAMFESTAKLKRGVEDSTRLLRQILDLLPPLPNQNQSTAISCVQSIEISRALEEHERLVDSNEISRNGTIAAAQVFAQMPQRLDFVPSKISTPVDAVPFCAPKYFLLLPHQSFVMRYYDFSDSVLITSDTLKFSFDDSAMFVALAPFLGVLTGLQRTFWDSLFPIMWLMIPTHGFNERKSFDPGIANESFDATRYNEVRLSTDQLALKNVYCDDSIGEYTPRVTLIGFDPGGRYSHAGFDMNDVFLHIKLIEQASVDESPALVTQEVSNDEVPGSVFKLTFACTYSISWPAMSGALDSASMCYKKIQIFEQKGFTLGVVHLLVHAGQANLFTVRIENALKSAIKRPKPTTVKLPFSLCGCQDENPRWRELGDFEDDPSDQSYKNGIDNSNMPIQVEMPLPTSSFVVSVDQGQTIQSGGEEHAKWLLNSDHLEFIAQVGPSTFQGVYKGRRIGIEKLQGCDKGNAYEFELHRDLLELLTCGHKNILQFYGVCVDETHGLCVVTKLMEGGSVSGLIMRNRKLPMQEIVRIATDFAEAIKFVNDHDVAYRDLNTQRILMDRHRNACLGDMGIVTACKILGEAVEYATDGYRWLAPEIIAGAPKSGYLMSTKDPFIDWMGRLAQNAYMVSSKAGTLLDTYEKLVEFPFMLQVFAKNPKRKTSANILFGNALSHVCWQPTAFFQSTPFDPVADSMGRVVSKSSYFGRQRRYLHAFTYAQQALSSSLFFPQPCGQGCFDGDGNVMNSAATIGLVNENASNDPQGLRRSTRAKQLPEKYDDFKMQGMVAMWTNT